MASQAPAEPSARRQYGCPECGSTDIPQASRGPARMFCSPEHKRAFFNRAAAEGRAVIMLLKAWRLSRNHKDDRALGARCLSEISAIVDLMNERDRGEGRNSHMTLGYAERTLSGGKYMDRTYK